MEDKDYKRKVIVVSCIVLTLITLSVILVAYGIGTGKKSGSKTLNAKAGQTEQAGEEENTETIPQNTLSTRGFIYALDPENKEITFFSIDNDVNISLYYSGGTDMRSAYGKVISAGMLQPGDFYEAVFTKEYSLVSLKGIEDAWTYDNIFNMAIDDEKQRILIGETIYRYNDDLHVLDGESFVGLNDLSSKDILKAKGIDNYIYLIEISTGHGYLSFTDYEAFLGGSVLVDGTDYGQLDEDTKLTLSQGYHEITVYTAELSAEGEIDLKAHENHAFSLKEFTPPPVQYGMVTFTVEPFGADLYIDGEKTSYGSPMELAYGEHRVEAELGGYRSYSGSFTLAKEKMKLKIMLLEAPEPTAVPTPVPVAEPTQAVTPTPAEEGAETASPTPAEESAEVALPMPTEPAEAASPVPAQEAEPVG